MERRLLGSVLDSFHSPTLNSSLFLFYTLDCSSLFSLFISLSLPLMIGDDMVRINPPEPKKLIQLQFFSFQNLLFISVYSRFIPYIYIHCHNEAFFPVSIST